MSNKPHKWVAARLGHSDTVCAYCSATPAEIRVIGDMNHCEKAPTEEIDPTPEAVLAMHLCAVIPSAAAIEHAALEWQVIRKAWLRYLDKLGVSESDMREAWRAAHAAGVAAGFRGAYGLGSPI